MILKVLIFVFFMTINGVLLGMGIANYRAIRECKKSNEERYEESIFVPYLCKTLKEAKIYSNDFEELPISLKPNTFQTIVFEKDDYAKLLSGAGWVRKSDITNETDLDIPYEPVKLKEEAIVRNGPGRGYMEIGKLKKGTVVNVVSSIGCWLEIEFSKGTGFILRK